MGLVTSCLTFLCPDFPVYTIGSSTLIFYLPRMILAAYLLKKNPLWRTAQQNHGWSWRSRNLVDWTFHVLCVGVKAFRNSGCDATHHKCRHAAEAVNCSNMQAQLKSWRAGCECQRKSGALCEGLDPLNPHCDGPSGLDLPYCHLLPAWLSLDLLSRSKSKVNDLLFSTFINWINNSDSCKLIF